MRRWILGKLVKTLRSFSGWVIRVVAALSAASRREEELATRAAEARFQRAVEAARDSEAYRKKAWKNYIVWKSEALRKKKESIGCCEKCGRSDFELTIDHIVPVSFLRDFGVAEEDDRDERNLRLLCKPCNSMKSNRFDFTDERTKPLLMHYLGAVPGPVKFADAREVVNPRKKPKDDVSYPALPHVARPAHEEAQTRRKAITQEDLDNALAEIEYEDFGAS